MMRRADYVYERDCPASVVAELYDLSAPSEGLAAVPREAFVAWEMQHSAARYAVRLRPDPQAARACQPGRGLMLCGVAFVHDMGAYREMCFTKTEWFVTEKKITFARTIPQLFADLDAHERERIGDAAADAAPLYMHTPEGDARSREWFLKCGCTEGEHGLLCPGPQAARAQPPGTGGTGKEV